MSAAAVAATTAATTAAAAGAAARLTKAAGLDLPLQLLAAPSHLLLAALLWQASSAVQHRVTCPHGTQHSETEAPHAAGAAAAATVATVAATAQSSGSLQEIQARISEPLQLTSCQPKSTNSEGAAVGKAPPLGAVNSPSSSDMGADDGRSLWGLLLGCHLSAAAWVLLCAVASKCSAGEQCGPATGSDPAAGCAAARRPASCVAAHCCCCHGTSRCSTFRSTCGMEARLSAM